MPDEHLRYSPVLDAVEHMDQGGDLGLLERTTGMDGTGSARRRA